MKPRDAQAAITLSELPASGRTRSPFNGASPGFTADWWDAEWDYIDNSSRHCFIALEDDVEVARVLTDPEAELYSFHYEGLAPLKEPVEVFRFEVRADQRGRGIGTRALQLLKDRYAGRDLYAFGDEVRFWRTVSWREYSRLDGDTMFVPLFVHHHAAQ
ncbi:GNAT family N-acetyltransferase [Leifsonia sp. NPDC058230]|uniref:GNAT family N-acetyltransferase n=1 Tax=Leifsonia sp. NPDC058230 TaxID=3346391 RepID=UPI0036DED21A